MMKVSNSGVHVRVTFSTSGPDFVDRFEEADGSPTYGIQIPPLERTSSAGRTAFHLTEFVFPPLLRSAQVRGQDGNTMCALKCFDRSSIDFYSDFPTLPSFSL